MLDNLEALAALADCGTMNKAAVAIHISQSAISKRIANLEFQLKQKLIEPNGRRVDLTPAALRLLEKARPLISELKESFLGEKAEASGTIVIDVAVSVLISWGAEALAKVRKSLPNIELKVTSNHASVAVERVRSGQSMLALAQGIGKIAPELQALQLYEQTLVIVPAELKPFKIKSNKPIKLISMETYAEAGSIIQRGLRQVCSASNYHLEIDTFLQSFSAIAQMARAGFGHGLVPLDVAQTLGIPKSKLVSLPKPGITVPVSLITRRSTFSRPLIQEFLKKLQAQVS